jgi:hypothetical protein
MGMADLFRNQKTPSIQYLTVYDRRPVIFTQEIKKSRFAGRSGSGVSQSGDGSERR